MTKLQYSRFETLEIRALNVQRKINKPHHPVCSNINTWLIPCLHCSFISANIFYTACLLSVSRFIHLSTERANDAHCNTFSTICLDREFSFKTCSVPRRSRLRCCDGGICLSNPNSAYKAPSWWLKHGNRDVPCSNRSKHERARNFHQIEIKAARQIKVVHRWWHSS